MNKELEISIKSVLHRFVTTEMKYDAATSEIIALCADEAIEIILSELKEQYPDHPVSELTKQTITAIKKRMK